MFIAALFTIAKIWKQPKCPSAVEWIRKLWYIFHNEILLGYKKKKPRENLTLCNCMAEPGEYYDK